ncbi:hypothetical protein Tco_0913094 [Tanacetum coccineum]
MPRQHATKHATHKKPTTTTPVKQSKPTPPPTKKPSKQRTKSEKEIAAPKGDKDQGEVDSSTVTSGVSIPVSDPEKAHEALAGPDPEPMQEDQQIRLWRNTCDKEVTNKVKDHKRKHDSDDDEDDDDDEGPSAGSNQGKSAKRRRHDSGASGSAQPPTKDDEQSSKKPRESDASASKQTSSSYLN